MEGEACMKGSVWWKIDATWPGGSASMCGEQGESQQGVGNGGNQDEADGGNTNFSNAKKLVQQAPLL